MTVAALQKHLHDLTALIESSGASATVVKQFGELSAAYEPFAAQSIAEFTAFLLMAEEYRRTGQIPATAGKKPRAPRIPKEPKAAKPSLEATRESVRTLYERAGHLSDDLSDLDATMAIVSGFIIKDLKTIAAAVNASYNSNAKKPEILAAIKFSITDRRGSLERIEQ